MFVSPISLRKTVKMLIRSDLNLSEYINKICNRIDNIEKEIHALIPEPNRRERLIKQAKALEKKYINPDKRPPLYGVLVGIKDIINVDGFITKAGSNLPPDLFSTKEASCVKKLRDLGSIILGKTVTTEFALSEPGPTRNPYNLDHTPGGSSSGSAASVAAGYCPLALGTQTGGSVIRPASYCGIVGFKPSYNRVKIDGLITVSHSFDHLGLFTKDIDSLEFVASLFVPNWRNTRVQKKPILGIPVGSYLNQATPEILDIFNKNVRKLEKVGFIIKEIKFFNNINEINHMHRIMTAAEMSNVHSNWYKQYEQLYSNRTANFILEGKKVDAKQLKKARALGYEIRYDIENKMRHNNIDLLISPSSTGAAPKGLEFTGDASMNIVWSYSGLPVVSLPMGFTSNYLPVGLQIVSTYMKEEELIVKSKMIAHRLKKYC